MKIECSLAAAAALLLATGAGLTATQEPPAEPPPAAHGPEHSQPGEHGHGHDEAAGHHPDATHDNPHHGGDGMGLHHDFSDVEKWSARFDDPARDAWQRPAEVVELMRLAAGMTVADVGAGTGYFMAHLAAAVGESGRVWALDVEPEMVRFMTERAARQELATVTARRIPYDSTELAAGSVDRVLIVNTWHHIDHRRAYAAGLAEVLSPGGEVYVVDFTRDSPEGPPPEHRLPPERVIEELRAGGLEGEVVEEELPRQYIVRARRGN